MGARFGDEDETPVERPVDGEEITDGEAIYTVLCAALVEATPAQRTEIGMALLGGLDAHGAPAQPFEGLSEESRELFEMAGETLFDDDDEDEEG